LVVRPQHLGISLNIPTALKAKLLPQRTSDNSSALKDFLGKSQESSDIKELMSSLLVQSAQALKTSKIAISVSPEVGSFPLMLYNQGLLETLDDEGLWSQPLVSWLAFRSQPIRASEMEALPQWKELPLSLSSLFEKLDGRVYGPLCYGGRLIGLLILGPKIRNKRYSSRDIRMLDVICCLGAAQIENARLSRQLESNFEALSLAEEEVIRTTKLASLGHLVAEVAHEVGNSLQALHHLIYTLPGQDLSEWGRQGLALADEEVIQTRCILQELLSFARPGDGKCQPQDLRQLTNSVLCLARLHPNAAEIEVRVSFEEDLPLISASGERLKQVLFNVVRNAFDEMVNGGTLSVEGRCEGGSVTMEFTDTGPGMSEEAQQRIFEPFYTTKPAGKGTGLGLSVSQKIIAHHEGRIRVRSSVGLGTSVIIELPTAHRNGDCR